MTIGPLVTFVPNITRQHPHSDSGLGERYGLAVREELADDVLLLECSGLRENMLDFLLVGAAANLGELGGSENDVESAVSYSSAVDAIREWKQGIA